MKFTAILGIAVAALAASGLSCADNAPTPLTRAEVKAETRALQRAHQLTPAGHDGIADPYPQRWHGPAKTPEERRDEILGARRNGELGPAGDASDLKADRTTLAAKTTTVRAERKAETHAALMARQLTPAGEGPDAPRK